MFNFSRDDEGSSIRIPYKYQDVRMLKLRHNPYVGSFHSMHRQDITENSNDSIVNSRSGNVPLIRHAPSTISSFGGAYPKGIGLKGLFHSNQATLEHQGHRPDIFQQSAAAPMLSQSALSRIKAFEKSKHLSLTALKRIPIIIFQNGDDLSDGVQTETDIPACSICLEKYNDGDELRSLGCNHCFHKKCIDIWLLGYLSVGAVDTCRCPQCRQEVVDLDVNINFSDSLVLDSDTPGASFIRIGQSLSTNDNPLSVSLSSSIVSTPSLSNSPMYGDSTILVAEGSFSNNLRAIAGPMDDDTIIVDEDDCLCGSAYSFCDALDLNNIK
jgi:hypothetical protein